MPAGPLASSQLDHPCRAWDASTLWSRSGWRLRIPGEVIDEALSWFARQPAGDDFFESFEFQPKKQPALARFGLELRQRLFQLEGVCWIRRLDDWRLSGDEQRFLFLALGLAMGNALTPYGRLYAVEDRGVDYTRMAVPVSATAAATGFHTDSSSVDTLPDIVGLLCEEPSTLGGESLITNALRAYRDLYSRMPEAIAILEQEFIRDVVTPGRERTHSNLLRNRFPIFSGRGHSRTFRYMRYWIEQGQERAGLPLSKEQVSALDALDGLLAAPEHAVQFRLERGDMLFVDNRTVAHNRLAYQNSPGTHRRLQRMWIETSPTCAHSLPASSPSQSTQPSLSNLATSIRRSGADH